MTHVLAMSNRDAADDIEELVLLKPNTEVPAEVSIELKSFTVPSDAAFVKYLTPKFISCNSSKPCYMWAGREFETTRGDSVFPAYFVGGFGILDACLQAHATNATLALHPLDIILTVCYGYGTQRKRTIYNNNSELQKCSQIVLKSEFTKSNLLLALVAKLARRVETFPLPKLYGLINAELSSPDPLVVRLALSVLSYLATTRDSVRNTLDTFKNLSEMRDKTTMDELLESRPDVKIVPMGMLDVRHDSNSPSWRKLGSKDANNQQSQFEKGVRGDPEVVAMAASTAAANRGHGTASAQGRNPADTIAEDTANDVISGNSSLRAAEPRRPKRRDSQMSVPLTAQTEAAASASDDMKVHGNWNLTFDSNTAEEGGEADEVGEREATAVAPPEEAKSGSNAGLSSPLDVLSMVSSEAADGPEAPQRNDNNAEVNLDQEAEEWLLRLPRAPARVYRLNQGCGVHSVLFKGNQRAWLELPEVLHELCQFFAVESNLREKVIRVALNLQMTRLNFNDECRKWWPGMLFKDTRPENPMQDGDICITGWLGTLLGERTLCNYGPVTINHLASMKIAVKLPVLLVRLPKACSEDSDDAVLDSEDGISKTRLNYHDEYRERLVNSSSNANEVPVGLFMPWRSCDALNRTRRLWRQVGGDAPSETRGTGVNEGNVSNAENRTYPGGSSAPDHRMYNNDESVIKKWAPMRGGSASAKACCSCCSGRSRRQQKGLSEPHYNMSCLITGMGGFCLQPATGLDTDGDESSSRTCVRPLCFVDLVYQS